MLAKSVLPESTKGFAGVYAGSRSTPSVDALVDNADLIVALGCVFGRQYRTLAERTGKGLLAVGDGAARMGGKPIPVELGPLLSELLARPYTPQPAHAALNPLQGLSFAAPRKS